MIRLTFNNTDKLVVNWVQSKGNQLIDALQNKMSYLMILLQQKIVREKLSGQVLKHRSGKLAGSIVAYPATLEEGEIIGKVEGAGGPAWYGRVHEFGGSSSYPIVAVNKKALHFFIGSKEVFAKRVLHPPLPQRAFMAPSLAEMKPEIVNGLAETVAIVMRKT